MNFKKHYDLEGLHSFLSPSKYHWLRYDEDKIIDSYHRHTAAQRGTELHELAKDMIRLGVKLPKSKQTLNMYVNDAIGFQMSPEQVLFYSEFCFGTADTISFRKNVLRIHDLKTGVTPAMMDQLIILAALFCLEYIIKPHNITIELRIYQNDEILVLEPSPNDIYEVMEKIIYLDHKLQSLRSEE